ncbi:MAG: hypothetical protein ABI910_15780 [Gemmatimonadota bacterium]
MNRVLLGTIVLATLTACQDSTTAPNYRAPIDRAPTPARETASEEVSGPGAAAVAHLYAVVSQNGALLSGKGVSQVQWLGTGRYEVSFNTNVRSCGFLATTTNAYSQALDVFTASGHLSAQGVYVETKNQGGGLTDGPFNLVVTCGNDGIPFVAVGYSANYLRGSAGTSLSYLGAGRYTVNFPTAVNSCAFLATVADSGNTLVYSPSYVFTASGPTTKSIYIETKNPGGGLQDGVPFHVAAICPNVAKTRYAVVKVNGTLHRANPGTTSTMLATGKYQITHNQNLTGCARIATRGSVGTGVPFNPARMEIVAAAGSGASGVWVRELAFFGANFTNQAFHLGVVC